MQVLRTRVNQLTDWRRQIAEHREQLITGAAVAGLRDRHGDRAAAAAQPLSEERTSAQPARPLRASQISAGAVAKVVLVAALVVARPLPRLPDPRRDRPAADRAASSRSRWPRRSIGSIASACPGGWRSSSSTSVSGRRSSAIGLLIVPPLVDGIEGLSEDIPGYIEDLRENESFRDFDDEYNITESVEDQASELPSRLGDAAGTLRDVTVGVFSSFVQLFLILVVAFFLLMEGRKILDFVYRQMPPHRENRLRDVADDISGAVSGYVFGAFSLATLAGIVTYVTLELLGVPFALPLAIGFAFFDLVPLVGATIGGILVAIVVGFTAAFPVALIVWVAVLLIYQQIENNVLAPYVYGQAVRVHPLGILIGILIGASLLGILGALVAIPASAAIQAVIRDYWAYSDRNLARVARQAAAAVDPDEDQPDAPGAKA